MYKLLVVEDQNLVRDGVKMMLNAIYPDFFNIYEADNGLDGIKIANEVHPEIVITDIIMPELSGLDMICELSANYPKMMFIIMSAYEDFNYAISALKLGVKEYLMKPVTEKMLYSSIQKLIGNISQDNNFEYSDLILYDFFASIEIAIDPQVVSKYSIIEKMSERNWSIGIIELKSSDQITLDDLQSKLEYIFHNAQISFISFQNYKSRIAVIFNYKNINEFEQIIRQSLSDMSGYSYVGISEFQLSDGKQLKTLFHQAEYALEQAIYHNSSLVFFGSSTHDHCTLMTKTFCENLHKKIVSNDKMAVNNLLDSLFTEFNKLSTSKEMVQNELEKVFLYFKMNGNQPKEVENALMLAREQMISAKTIFMIKATMFTLTQKMMDIYKSNVNYMSLIKAALNYVEENYSKEITAATLANLSNMSYSYFCTYFSKHMGMTTTQFINEVRLRHAKDMLEHSLMKVNEVSSLCGFSDYRYFSKLFSAKYGKKPATYKRS